MGVGFHLNVSSNVITRRLQLETDFNVFSLSDGQNFRITKRYLALA